MTTPATAATAPAVSREVVLGGLCFITGAVVGAVAVNFQDTVVTFATWSVAGWVVASVAGVVLLDRVPGHQLGRFLAAAGLIPVALALVGPEPLAATARLGGLLMTAVAIGVPWAWWPRATTWVRRALAGLALTGGLVVTAGATTPGWAAVAAGVLGWWVVLLVAARREQRDRRRAAAWLAVTTAAALGVTTVGWLWLPEAAAPATFAALVGVALTAVRLTWATALRPLTDHLIDVGLLVTALLPGAVVGALVWGLALVAHLPSPAASAGFSGLAALTASVPAAWWLRRSLLARRYGPGALSADDVALITADLHTRTDPRELLERAARMVAAASGSPEARIELGEESEPPAGWTAYPLVVGGDRLGALLVRARGPEGPEPRELRVVSQLLPTVALVARAVGLAVEAERARLDVARQRDAERARILEDLHDGLGPVLAGMSMRVQAGRRSPDAAVGLLDDLAGDLARSRSDLRSLVSGLTPSALDESDLAGALDRLVQSFRAPGAEPRLSLRVHLDEPLAREHQVVVYRCVAEGLTNALRHARPTRIDVCVRGGAGAMVEVVDDGVGGPVVPGVGLSSLQARAERLGGGLRVTPVRPHGSRLELWTGAVG